MDAPPEQRRNSTPCDAARARPQLISGVIAAFVLILLGLIFRTKVLDFFVGLDSDFRVRQGWLVIGSWPESAARPRRRTSLAAVAPLCRAASAAEPCPAGKLGE